MSENKDLRKNLPIDYLNLGNYLKRKLFIYSINKLAFKGGISFNDTESNNKKRNLFIQKIIKLSQKVIEDYLPIDAALDQFGKKYLEDSLPPFIKDDEMKRSIHGTGGK
jgi:hypothetical protein